MRKAMCFLSAAVFAAGFGGTANAQQYIFEPNRDRPGSDFAATDLSTPSPTLCAQLCSAQASCKSWSYAKPGLHGPLARCFLKNAIPMQASSTCCTSGVKLAGAVPPGASVGFDRPCCGFWHAVIPTPNPMQCYNACNASAQCKAWSYVSPGITVGGGLTSAWARCWMKNSVPAKVADSCCMSGVKGELQREGGSLSR